MNIQFDDGTGMDRDTPILVRRSRTPVEDHQLHLPLHHTPFPDPVSCLKQGLHFGHLSPVDAAPETSCRVLPAIRAAILVSAITMIKDDKSETPTTRYCYIVLSIERTMMCYAARK